MRGQPDGTRTGEGRRGPLARVMAVGALALTAANCSGPQVTAGRSGVDPRYGVSASPRLYGENDVIPKGGGRTLVGRPYEIAGKTYVPQENPRGYTREGLASWYGTAFHGRLTANGEVFDRTSVAAAHPTLPLPSYARVTNLANGSSMIVRVNDRGPYHASRLVDVSEQVAEALDFRRTGTTRVRLDYVGRASTRGSDDRKLLATLRTDGRPATIPGRATTQFAEASEATQPIRAVERVALAARGEPPRQDVPRQDVPRQEVVREEREIVRDEAATVEVARRDVPRPAIQRVASALPEDDEGPAPPRAESRAPPLRTDAIRPEAPRALPLPLAGPPLRIVTAPLPPGRPAERLPAPRPSAGLGRATLGRGAV